jgi:TusA-related sulfurtransferase
MGLLSFFSRSSDLEPGDTIEVLDESGDTVEAIRRGARASMQVVVTSTEGRYEGMGQYVERERMVSKKAEP